MSRLQKISSGLIFPIPHLSNKYVYELLHGVRNIRTDEKLPVKDGFVELTEGVLSLRIDEKVLAAIASKNFRIPIESWDKFEVIFPYGEESNDPRRMILRPIEPVEAPEMDGFYEIPGFSMYITNRKGDVYSRNVNRLIEPYTDAMGYTMYGVTPDIGNRTILGRHRLLALAFLKYDGSVDRCDVNHINGVKSDNRLENLEWASRKLNCVHAYSAGLRTDNNPILVRNTYTGEILEFYSAGDCARKLKLSDETARLRAKTQGQQLFFPGFLFKFKADKSEWKQSDDIFSELIASGLPRQLLITEIDTGREMVAGNLASCSRIIGLNDRYIREKLKLSPFFDRNGYRVKYLDFEQVAKSIFDEIRNM